MAASVNLQEEQRNQANTAGPVKHVLTFFGRQKPGSSSCLRSSDA